MNEKRPAPQISASEAIDGLTTAIVDEINKAPLHPAIVRLVLLNVLHAVEDQERAMAQSAEKRGEPDGERK